MHSRRYVICDNEGSATHTVSGEITCGTPRATEVPSPKHTVSEALLALAKHKRPEANRLIELRPYASQRHKRCVAVYVGIVSVGR
jgi:hypothetical protein